ncbi:hypothetical protein PYW07_014312 [Mythimna separata]|uniref:Uncharacterized protein n=1 Tax=Mythimna separata TaxID=271217 RepID=A0AAD7YZ88_MYTSE|nr:hypothetical protein PYW07_014312 [Mythimna separata]
MDSIKVVFLLTLFSIVKCHADLWQFRRAVSKNKVPTIFNKNIYNIPSILKDIRDNPYRRSLVSTEDSEPNVIVVRKSSFGQNHPKTDYRMHRRMYDFHPGMKSNIISAPAAPNHLPEAEPILPGHTLLRPALGMLKSQVKFPHKDMGDGAGVYGNFNNLGITYSGTGERVLYTGFRRSDNNFNDDDTVRKNQPRFLIALLHEKPIYEEKPIARFIDYGKREIENKKRLEEEKQKKLMPPDPYNAYATENKIREVKRLLKSLTSNGVTLEFFEIPRLKVEAMKDENDQQSIKPYTEFLVDAHEKDLSRDRPQKSRTLAASRQGGPAGIKRYIRR